MDNFISYVIHMLPIIVIIGIFVAAGIFVMHEETALERERQEAYERKHGFFHDDPK